MPTFDIVWIAVLAAGFIAVYFWLRSLRAGSDPFERALEEFARQQTAAAGGGSIVVTIKVGGRPFNISPRGTGSVWSKPLSLFGPRLLDPDEAP